MGISLADDLSKKHSVLILIDVFNVFLSVFQAGEASSTTNGL